MVAANTSDKWFDILDRVSDELELAHVSRIYGELTLTVKFEKGEAVHERVVITKSRRLTNTTQ